MARWPKPPEGSWTEHFQLGTEPISYEDSISPEFYELEREAIFKRAWLNVGRVEQLPRKGSYFTKELAVARTSVVIVRGADDEVRAFYNVCRHRGNKLVWSDFPKEETSGVSRQFVCKYHGWRYDLDGACNFVQQEQEFFDLDKADYGLVPVHCDVWAGFIFVNLAKQPEQSLLDFLGPMVTKLENYPFAPADRALVLPRHGERELEALHGRLPGVLPRTGSAREADATRLVDRRAAGRLRGAGVHDRRPAPSWSARPASTRGTCRTTCSSRWSGSPAAGSSGPGTSPTSTTTRRRRASTRPGATRGASTRSRSSRTSSSWSGGRTGTSPTTTGRRATARTSSRARCTSCRRRRRASGWRTSWPRCRSRSTGCRTPTRSRPPRRCSSHGCSSGSR